MKKVKGYNFSRDFMNDRAPQHVQNIIIKDFCDKKKLKLLLSSTEYSMKGSYHILEEMTQNLKKIDGIVAYSVFQMPEDEKKRNKIIKKIINQKKILGFAVEQLIISSLEDIKKIEKLWQIKKTLPFCLKR